MDGVAVRSSIELPADTEQVPDVFVYLCAANMTGEGSSDIAYARFKRQISWQQVQGANVVAHANTDPCVGTIGDSVFLARCS